MKKIIASITAIVFFLLPVTTFAQTVTTITLNSATKYQTMVGWEAAGQSGEVDSPVFPQYSDYLLDQAVNDLGINRLRMEVKSDPGVPNSPFNITNFDNRMDKVVVPMKQKLQARGEDLWINGIVVGSQLADNPTMYAQQVLALYQHMQQKYGFIPNSWEIALEPDVFGWGNTVAGATKMGNAIIATGDLLTANGFPVYFVAPSNTSTANAVTPYLTTLTTMPGVMQYVKEIAYHDYHWSGADLISMKNTATQYGIPTAMLEHIGADYNELYINLTQANVSAFQQFTLAYPATDNGAQYYVVNNTGTTPQTMITIGSRTKYLRQYFKYIRKGAQRIGATSTNNGLLAPTAYINTNGNYVVVMNATATGNFTIKNLPAGNYGIFYTTATEYDTNLPDQTITAGQNLSSSMPAAGVITVYAKPLTPSPSPSPSPAISPSPSPTPSPSPSPSPVKIGDIDGNGRVDIFDYNQLLSDFGKTQIGLLADLDGNGTVNIFDFNLLLTNFGL